jgi:MoxR-like ATPase
MSTLEEIRELTTRMSQSIIGQSRVVERLVIALLSNGNVLVEGLPGLAKTRAIKSLAKNLEAEFSRIQFTPDLLPSDITGTDMYVESAGGGAGHFEFRPGPIFGNVILADEINRAPAKVQAALLEAMEERQVTVSGEAHKLPDLFMVMATQNPVEQEGTYPLPEAQLDRFLMHVRIDYPKPEDEIEVLRLVRGEESNAGGGGESALVSQSSVFEAREAIRAIHISDTIDRYIIDLIDATRNSGRFSPDLERWIIVGASPRGAIALDRCARAYAWLHGESTVIPDHVQAVAHDCLRHRLMLSYEAQADAVTSDAIIDQLLEHVAVA